MSRHGTKNRKGNLKKVYELFHFLEDLEDATAGNLAGFGYVVNAFILVVQSYYFLSKIP
jgi:hypothetical protein